MGRRKSYDREALVGKAKEIFRDHGFGGTSAEMLVQGLGVNRSSLYAEFGSKLGLFEAALERYDAEVVERNFGPLEVPGAGLDEIRALLEFFGAATRGPAAGRGCLLCNTAVEFGPEDPGGQGFVQRYFERLSAAFRAALGNARDLGELRSEVDPRAEASFFTAAVVGLFVLLRARAPEKVVEEAVRIAVEHLEGLRAAC